MDVGFRRKRAAGSGRIELPLTEMGKAEFSFGSVGDVSKISTQSCQVGSLTYRLEVLETEV